MPPSGIKVVTLSIPVADYYIKHSEKYVTQAALYEKIITNPRFSPYIYQHIDHLDRYAKDHVLLRMWSIWTSRVHNFFKQVASDLSKIFEEIRKAPWPENAP